MVQSFLSYYYQFFFKNFCSIVFFFTIYMHKHEHEQFETKIFHQNTVKFVN